MTSQVALCKVLLLLLQVTCARDTHVPHPTFSAVAPLCVRDKVIFTHWHWGISLVLLPWALAAKQRGFAIC